MRIGWRSDSLINARSSDAFSFMNYICKWQLSLSTPQRARLLLSHEMFEILSRDGKHIHILFKRSEANEAFGEKLSRALL